MTYIFFVYHDVFLLLIFFRTLLPGYLRPNYTKILWFLRSHGRPRCLSWTTTIPGEANMTSDVGCLGRRAPWIGGLEALRWRLGLSMFTGTSIPRFLFLIPCFFGKPKTGISSSFCFPKIVCKITISIPWNFPWKQMLVRCFIFQIL